MDLYYNNLEETEQDRLDEKRYAEKRSMTEDQKKEVISRITEESAAMIEKMIAASGEKPAEYTPVTRECMASMIYGALCAKSIEELGYADRFWIQFTGSVLIHHFLGGDIDDAIAAVKYFQQNDHYQNNPDINPEIYKLIHFGMDTYFCIDQPEQLEKRIRFMICQCRELFET